MKYFIAQIDISIIEIVPQKAQIQILKNFLKKDEEIINYSIENKETRDDFLSLKKLLINSKNINGVLFFSLIQFCYNDGNEVNFEALEKILQKYEIIFFREDLRIKNFKHLKKIKKKLKLFKYNNLKVINKFND